MTLPNTACSAVIDWSVPLFAALMIELTDSVEVDCAQTSRLDKKRMPASDGVAKSRSLRIVTIICRFL
jgi:hypothetical protein